MPVIVVTDSSAGVPAELAARLDIRTVPLHVLIDGVELREGIDPMPVDYTAAAASTSAASPGDLRDAYKRAYAASGGDGVLGVHISRQLSGTWEAARHAAADLDGPVRLVDSLGAGLGTGFPAIAAARRAQAGADLDEVYRTATRVAERARCFIVVDRLEQLRRGGRISTAAAVFGTALITRPLLHIVDGRIALADKARTTSKVFDKLIAAAVRAAGEAPTAIAVQHLDAAPRAGEVVEQLRTRISNAGEVIVAEFGPTLGIHLGPGAVGVLVIPDQT